LKLPLDISSCHAIIKQQSSQIEECLKLILSLEQKQKELEVRLNQNSKNSSKPPSKDGFKKPKSKSRAAFPGTKGGKQGGQFGHNGKTLEMVEVPDQVIQLVPEKCDCGHVFSKEELDEAFLKQKRQVFDLPTPKLDVYEYQQLSCQCPSCNTQVAGIFPDQVNSRVQYGTGAKALMVLLNMGYHLPVNKIKSLFSDLFGYPVNEATIQSATSLCYTKLESSQQAIQTHLEQQAVVHLDETGIGVNGKLHWLHTCSSTCFTYLFTHAKRGTKALEDTASMINRLTNYVIHDCWKSYFKYENCQHGLCGAHIVRELVGLDQNGTLWANWFRRFLLVILALTKENGGVLTKKQQKRVTRMYRQIWKYADQIEPKPKKIPHKRGRPKASKGRNLLTRLDQHQDALLAFAFHKQVPFTNNQAERDLRPIKTKLKVSGCFRTSLGAERYARIFSFISTARKQQVNIFQELKNALNGYTFLTTKP